MVNNIPSFDPGSEADLWQALNQIMSDYLNLNLCTCQPVVVHSVNEPYVDLKPVVQSVLTSGKTVVNDDDDVIQNVPIMMAYGNDCQITFHVKPGDFGLLIVCKFDISDFKQNKEILPLPSPRQFNWSDGFFLPITWGNWGAGVIIRNKSTQIDLQPENINMNTSTTTINSPNINVTSEIIQENSSSGITSTTPIYTINGNLTVTGVITANNGTMTMSGGNMTTNGDVIAGGISLKSHTHGGVQPGSGSTGGPQ